MMVDVEPGYAFATYCAACQLLAHFEIETRWLAAYM